MQIKSLRIKSCRSWAIADTASEATILALSSCHPRRWEQPPIAGIMGKAVGCDEELEGVKQGSAATCWNEAERSIIRAADELHVAW